MAVPNGYESNSTQGSTEVEASTVAVDQASATPTAAWAADQPTSLTRPTRVSRATSFGTTGIKEEVTSRTQ